MLYGRMIKRISLLHRFFLLALPAGFHHHACSQQVPPDSLRVDSLRIAAGRTPPAADNPHQQYDVGNLFQDIFHPHKKPDSLHKRSGITVIPNIAQPHYRVSNRH